MGEFQSAGKTVKFTDQQTLRLASDLYQMLNQDYRGSKSIDTTRLEEIIRHLYAGAPLSEPEWNILSDLERRHGRDLETWQANGRDGQDAAVPTGPGRISEALSILPPSLRSQISRSERRKLREGRPSPPPNLREAPPQSQQAGLAQAEPNLECGTCKMFDLGKCWGYGNIRVDPDWVCDSWTLDPDWRVQDLQTESIL